MVCEKAKNCIFDVIVIGGGISGTMAAVAAARCGANVLLIEQNGFLGGNLTAACVGPMATFHSGNKQIIRGLMDELVQRLKAKKKSPGHVRDASNFTATVTPFDVEGMKVELENMVTEAGGTILYHTMLADVSKRGASIDSVTVCNKAGLTELKARVYVDGTGDADLAHFSGVLCTIGREGDGLQQPMTMMCKYSCVDSERLRNAMIYGDKQNFERMHRNISILKQEDHISAAQGFMAETAEATQNGELHINKTDITLGECGKDGEYIINATRVLHHDALNPYDLSVAEMEGRAQVQELDIFLHKHIPGFEHAVLTTCGPWVGVRSSRQIRGLYRLTVEDILNNRRFPDTVCYCGYPVDIHSPTNNEMKVVYPKGELISCIPYSCMVTASVDNLIVTGRCISATFEAQSAIRISATVGAMGHAAGLAAYYAFNNGCATRNIDIAWLHEKLLEQNAYFE